MGVEFPNDPGEIPSDYPFGVHLNPPDMLSDTPDDSLPSIVPSPPVPDEIVVGEEDEDEDEEEEEEGDEDN